MYFVMFLFQAKESFVPLSAALGITAENSAKQGEDPSPN
jgi:hypothetical protein